MSQQVLIPVSAPTDEGGAAESILKQNDNTPAFHLPVIGGNQSENKKKAKHMDSGMRRNDGHRQNHSPQGKMPAAHSPPWAVIPPSSVWKQILAPGTVEKAFVKGATPQPP